MSFSASFGSFEASHEATCPDVAPECAATSIPPHMHRVTLELSRYELDTAYGLRDRVQLFLRLPYDVKDQTVRYTTLQGAPFVPPYGDIHHRSETLTGFGDPTLGLEWAPSSRWLFGAGSTIPTGSTVEDPIELGREGLKHEHLQFGSGTMRPILSAQWRHPRFTARAESTLSLYENDHGFRAPSTFVWSAGPSFRVRRLAIDPRLSGQYQTIGRWSGQVDEGSGLTSGGLRLELSLPAGRFVVGSSVYRELWSHSLSGESFGQGTTIGVSVTTVR